MNYQIPLYIQLKNLIIQRIKDGEYLPGEKIPSEREMSSLYHINRMTVKHAINALIDEGYLFRVKNNGTFVTKKITNKILYLNDHSTGKSIGLGAFINKHGLTLKNTILEEGIIKDQTYIEKKLNLEHSEQIYALHRLRKIDNESIALEYCYLPFKYFDDIQDHDFSKASLYDYMKQKGHFPISFEQKLTIQKAFHPITKIMDISSDSYIYNLEYIGHDTSGNVVEFTTSYMPCDKAEYGFETFKSE